MRVTKNVWLAGGMAAAVVLAFYPIYFRPKFYPEEYSEHNETHATKISRCVIGLLLCTIMLTFAEEAQKRNRAVIPKDKLRQSGESLLG